MYFLSRTNVLYHYIAHVSPRRRYLYTGVIFILLIGFSYSIYRCVVAYILVYEQELRTLEKKDEQEKAMLQNNNDLEQSIERLKQDVHAFRSLKKEEEVFTELLFFVLDSARQSGLSVNSYTLQKNKNSTWRKKEKIHLVGSGELAQVIKFLQILKQSQKMITISTWSLMQSTKNMYTFAGGFSLMSVNS
jgi:cell division protein FtsB